jgi:hypothetical protein
MRRKLLLVCCALLGAAFAPGVHASGGKGSYELPWRTRGEVLEYRSCGCADSCWVAEVRDTRTKALRGRLRCDCERLFYMPGPHGPERVQAQSCEIVEGAADKSQAIGHALERLLLRAR